MKVNIKGRGMIPGVGKIAPVYNQELDEGAIRRLLNFSAFMVYDSITRKLITKKNVDEIVSSHEAVVEAVQFVKETPVVETRPDPIVEIPLPEITEDPVDTTIEETTLDDASNVTIEEVVEETPEVEVVADEDPVVEEVEESVAEETSVAEEKPQYTSKKKNKKNRH